MTNVRNCCVVNAGKASICHVARETVKLSMLTNKPLSNSLVENKATVSVIRATFGESLIHGEQVQVDSIVQVKRYRPINLRL